MNRIMAIQSAQKAVEFAPGAPLYALNSGFILEQTGKETQAQASLSRKALDLSPAWSTASFWE